MLEDAIRAEAVQGMEAFPPPLELEKRTTVLST
jgi:hypothetical protein